MTVDGARRRYPYGKTRAEVATKLSTAVKQRDGGLPPRGDREPVASFLTTWIQAQRRRVRPGTSHPYEQSVRVHALRPSGEGL